MKSTGGDKSTKKRYGRAWKRIRDKYAAEHPFCELCFDRGIIVPTEAERRPVEGRGSRNPYSPGSYRTARGSRVQNREIESENPYEKVTKIVTKLEIISIG